LQKIAIAEAIPMICCRNSKFNPPQHCRSGISNCRLYYTRFFAKGNGKTACRCFAAPLEDELVNEAYNRAVSMMRQDNLQQNPQIQQPRCATNRQLPLAVNVGGW